MSLTHRYCNATKNSLTRNLNKEAVMIGENWGTSYNQKHCIIPVKSLHNKTKLKFL